MVPREVTRTQKTDDLLTSLGSCATKPLNGGASVRKLPSSLTEADTVPGDSWLALSAHV